jgi:serine/threonine-protein kinase
LLIWCSPADAQVVGTVLNHYRITRALGRGGMGEVYEAEDTTLHRLVAVKVLAPAGADDPARR